MKFIKLYSIYFCIFTMNIIQASAHPNQTTSAITSGATLSTPIVITPNTSPAVTPSVGTNPTTTPTSMQAPLAMAAPAMTTATPTQVATLTPSITPVTTPPATTTPVTTPSTPMPPATPTVATPLSPAVIDTQIPPTPASTLPTSVTTPTTPATPTTPSMPDAAGNAKNHQVLISFYIKNNFTSDAKLNTIELAFANITTPLIKSNLNISIPAAKNIYSKGSVTAFDITADQNSIQSFSGVKSITINNDLILFNNIRTGSSLNAPISITQKNGKWTLDQ